MVGRFSLFYAKKNFQEGREEDTEMDELYIVKTGNDLLVWINIMNTCKWKLLIGKNGNKYLLCSFLKMLVFFYYDEWK